MEARGRASAANSLEVCDEFERNRFGRARLYRGLRGVDVACGAFAGRGTVAWELAFDRQRAATDDGLPSDDDFDLDSPGSPGSPSSPSNPSRPSSKGGNTSWAGVRKIVSKKRQSVAHVGDLKGVIDPSRAAELLRSVGFFRSVGYWKWDSIYSLRKCATFIQFTEGTVLFRHGDNPKDCYMIAKGCVAMYTMSDDALAAQKSPRLMHGKTNKGVMRFQTTEKGSTYSEESDFGELEQVLQVGALIGERSLQEKSRRNKTMVCEEDCELMVIQAKHYDEFIFEPAQRLAFFDQHLPAASDWSHAVALGKIDVHPSTQFVEEIHEHGHHFLYEGVVSEPAIVLIISGEVEVRRQWHSRSTPAYHFNEMPLRNSKSAPQILQVQNQTLQQRLQLQQRHRKPKNPLGSEVRDLMSKGSFADYIACDTLKKGETFCSISALPMPGVEPFSFVVVSKTCKIIIASERGLRKFPTKELEGMRKILGKATQRRLRDMEAHHPHIFGRAATPSDVSAGDNTAEDAAIEFVWDGLCKTLGEWDAAGHPPGAPGIGVSQVLPQQYLEEPNTPASPMRPLTPASPTLVIGSWASPLAAVGSGETGADASGFASSPPTPGIPSGCPSPGFAGQTPLFANLNTQSQNRVVGGIAAWRVRARRNSEVLIGLEAASVGIPATSSPSKTGASSPAAPSVPVAAVAGKAGLLPALPQQRSGAAGGRARLGPTIPAKNAPADNPDAAGADD